MTLFPSVYQECFGCAARPEAALAKLQKKEVGKPDFSIREEGAEPTAARGWLASIVMAPLYPAQSPLAKRLVAKLNPTHLDRIRRLDQMQVDKEGTHFTLPVAIERNGVRYHGLMMGKKENLTNGKWILQAMGRDAPIERAARKCRTVYSEGGYNVLMLNGPSIGRSDGIATPRTLGEAHEAALQFLEKAVNAKEIVIAGHSIGGGVVGQAILQHQFDPKRKYLVVRQATFDTVSNAVKRFLPLFKTAAEKAICASGAELDNIEPSKRLATLGIPEVIVQASHGEVARGETPKLSDFASDGVIDSKASLGYRLVKDEVLSHKTFRCIARLGHTEKDKYLAVSLEAIKSHFASKPSHTSKLINFIKNKILKY